MNGLNFWFVRCVPIMLSMFFSITASTEINAEPFSYFSRLKAAEDQVGAPEGFQSFETMKREEQIDWLESKRGLFDTLRTMRAISGDAFGAQQASLWFDIANGTAERYGVERITLKGDEKSGAALQAIVDEAKNRQVVILNEAHHIPLHRVFARQLASELRKIGFEYLAGEAFSPDIPLHPISVNQEMGFYVREPMYASFVRSAISEGWSFIGYDHLPEGTTSQAEHNRLREIGAANNLHEKIFSVKPKAKVFIYVGYAHAFKQTGVELGKWKSLATLLKERFGIDPLTIDQTTMIPRGDVRIEHPQYRIAINRFAPSVPIVLKNKNGHLMGSGNGGYDLEVYHPDEGDKSKEGRPRWMKSQAGLRSFDVPKYLLPEHGRRLIKAFYMQDGPQAIPVDIVIVEAGKPTPSLMLPPGAFRFSYED